jgi:hypothetical protein
MLPNHTLSHHSSLANTIPTREEIMKSPIAENAPYNGATSSLSQGAPFPTGPVVDNPSEEFDRELVGVMRSGN